VVTPPAWRILSGLAISGFLLALPGGLLPLWGYHVDAEFGIAANYFAALGIGMTIGSAIAIRFRSRVAVERVVSGGCFAGALVLVMLALASPPAPVWYQSLTLLIAGAAAGVINTSVFESLAPAWQADRAGTTLRAGSFFGAGSVLAAYLLSQCLESPNPPGLLVIAAFVPAAAGFAYSRHPLSRSLVTPLPVTAAVRDLRSILAILFALLLFFQFANEWSIAGWLPVFVIDRLGMSPSGAVSLLALYWISLTAGRAIAARLLPRVRHGRLLMLSAFSALFGCMALLGSATSFGVVLGILLTGGGFSAIYPLAAEQIATRFTYYHPGYFNGIFTFAMLGGILAPFVLGHAAAAWGLKIVPIAVMFGSCAVFALVSLIWLGRKVAGS
jgi:fucose permease